MGKKSEMNEWRTKRHGLFYVCLVFFGILVGTAGCYFAVSFTPEIKENLSGTIKPDSMVETIENGDSISASDVNYTKYDEFSDNETSNEVVKEIIAENWVEEGLSETTMNEENKETKPLTSTEKDDTKKETADNYVVSDTNYIALTTSKTCNLRTGPGVDYTSIKVVDAQSDVNVTGCVERSDSSVWYEVQLEDGTEGYISSTCLKDVSADNKTVTASLTVKSCPADNNTEQGLSTIATDEQVTSTEEIDVCKPVVVENPTTKYDYRPGDYVGEVTQFLGRPVSEAQAAVPSFINKWYGSTGRLHDNNWCTVEFLYKDVVYQINLNQADPGYSLMGVSCGMSGETARSILTSQGYPFDPFQPGMTHWMRSEDGRYEVEVMTYLDNTVLSVTVRLL